MNGGINHSCAAIAASPLSRQTLRNSYFSPTVTPPTADIFSG
jgi:hypothetical protein